MVTDCLQPVSNADCSLQIEKGALTKIMAALDQGNAARTVDLSGMILRRMHVPFHLFFLQDGKQS